MREFLHVAVDLPASNSARRVGWITDGLPLAIHFHDGGIMTQGETGAEQSEIKL